MKKSKLILIPALSVASVGAVVAPLATSCSSQPVLSVSDVGFEPETHTAKEIKTQTAFDELTKEYFSSATNFAKDLAYIDINTTALGKMGGHAEKIAQLKQSKEDNYITDYSYSFTFKINNINFEEKEMTINSVKTKGYLLNGSMSETVEMTVECSKEQAKEQGSDLKTVVKKTTNLGLSNVFIYINPKHNFGSSETPSYFPGLEFWLSDQVAWAYNWEETESMTSTQLDGSDVVDSTKDSASIHREKEGTDTTLFSRFPTIPAGKPSAEYADGYLYYFNNITYTAW